MDATKRTGDAASEAEAPELQFSTDERRVLELHDRLRDLEINIALLRAQQSYQPDPSIPDTDDALETAQEEAARAKASWLLRNDISDSVMTVNPIIKAVHGSTRMSPIESDLLPHIQARDASSATLATTATRLRNTLDELTATEADSLRAARRNAALAAELLELVAEAERRRGAGANADADDPQIREEMDALRAQVKASRQKWKVTKGTASAMVAGSGLDWARDEELTRMVLDPEDEV